MEIFFLFFGFFPFVGFILGWWGGGETDCSVSRLFFSCLAMFGQPRVLALRVWEEGMATFAAFCLAEVIGMWAFPPKSHGPSWGSPAEPVMPSNAEWRYGFQRQGQAHDELWNLGNDGWSLEYLPLPICPIINAKKPSEKACAT